MKRMALPALLASAVLALALTGCSGAQSMSDDTLKGIWKVENSGLGFDAYVNFEDDNIAELLMNETWLDGEWSVSGTEGKIVFNDYSMMLEGAVDDSSSSSSSDENKRTAKLTYSGGKLTLGSNDGSRLVFSKDDSEEAKSLFDFSDTSVVDGDGGEGDADVETVEEVIDPIDPAVVVADDDKFTISVTGKGTDYTGDPGYRLSITNKTDKAVYLVPEDVFNVGGKQIEAGLGDELEAGETLETFMYFAQDELGGGLDALTSVDGVIQVIDNETDDEVAKYTFHM